MIDPKTQDKKVPKLSKEQYWEWRTTICEMQLEQEKLKCAKMEHAHISRDAEVASLRAQLFVKTKLESASKKHESSVIEYNRFREALEKALGTSLSDKLIDDVTLEVRDLPPEEKKGI